MAGKDFSEQAYHIGKQFEDLIASSRDSWQDDQATSFVYDYVEPIRKALSDMQLPIESIIDLMDSKLNEIQSMANGR